VWPKDAPWWEDGYLHPRDRQVDAPDPGETFHSSVPSDQRVRIGRTRVDYNGQTYSKERMDSTSHAIIKCIRHSSVIPISPRGWCYLSDIAFLLWRVFKEYYYIWRSEKPSEAELMLAMELDLKKDRFQVSALFDKNGPHNIMVRAVQGHSGIAGGQVDDSLTHTQVGSVESLFHYSKQAYLDTIVGWNGRGLVAGGLLFNKSRTHVYCVTKPPPRDGWAHNPDRRHGTDIVIQLDHEKIAQENVMFQTAQGGHLAPEDGARPPHPQGLVAGLPCLHDLATARAA
jgi:RNA:NAD 2'-phosphotransferase (TPT1/KptA family)